MCGPDNEERADAAGDALQTFTEAWYDGRTPSQLPAESLYSEFRSERATAVADLICNLGHWCDRNGVDFVDALEHGAGMWSGERNSEDGEPDDGNDSASLTFPLNPDGAPRPLIEGEA